MLFTWNSTTYRMPFGDLTSNTKIAKISEYLSRIKLPSIDPLVVEGLDSPFTDEELLDTIKNTAVG